MALLGEITTLTAGVSAATGVGSRGLGENKNWILKQLDENIHFAAYTFST